MTERSDFADILQKALLAKGISYTGKITLTNEEINTYRDLSPKAMADNYSVTHNLEEKNKILKILKEIYKLNMQNVFHFATKDRLEEYDLDYSKYLFIFRHLNIFLSVDGQKAQTIYTWKKDSQPIFSDAAIIYDEYLKIKEFKLSPEQKDVIDKINTIDEQEIYNVLQTSDNHTMALKYHIREYLRYLKAKQRKIDNPPKKKVKELPPIEISRKLPVVENKVFNKIEEIMIQEEKEKEKIKNDPGDRILFILHKKLKLYKQLLKNEHKYSKYLEKLLLK